MSNILNYDDFIREIENISQLVSVSDGVSSIVGTTGSEIIQMSLTHKSPHLLVYGVTGKGHHNFLTMLIDGFCRNYSEEELELVLADFKGTEFKEYSGKRNIKVIEDNEGSGTFAGGLTHLKDEFRSRVNFLQSEGVKNIDEYNNSLTEGSEKHRLPRRVIIFHATPTDFLSNPNLSILFDVLRLGRFVGVHLVLSIYNLSVPERLESYFPNSVEMLGDGKAKLYDDDSTSFYVPYIPHAKALSNL